MICSHQNTVWWIDFAVNVSLGKSIDGDDSVFWKREMVRTEEKEKEKEQEKNKLWIQVYGGVTSVVDL